MCFTSAYSDCGSEAPDKCYLMGKVEDNIPQDMDIL